MSVEFQRIAMRDKKAFLRDHCKDTDENKRMGKTRDLFKKIKDTKRTFHAKMGTIKDRNGMDLNQVPYYYTVEMTNRFKGLDLIDRVPEEL